MGKTPIRKYKKKHTLIHQTKTSNRNKTSKRSKKINLFEVIVPAFLSFFVHSTLVSQQQKNNFFYRVEKTGRFFVFCSLAGRLGCSVKLKCQVHRPLLPRYWTGEFFFFIINLDLDYFFSTAENRRQKI